MEIIDIPIEKLKEARWNPNKMDATMLARLRASVVRFGLVQNLVVRPLHDGCYEVLSGNQRLSVLKDMGIETVPCVVVDLDDARARLLTQALNRVQGDDDLGLKAESLKKIMESLPQSEIMEVLPDSFAGLNALLSMNAESVATHLQNWEMKRHARLKHLGFQLTPDQLRTVERALTVMVPKAKEVAAGSPNIKGIALYLICKELLDRQGCEMSGEIKLHCPVCSAGLCIRITHSRRSNKPGLMLICPVDGRHLRGFITDQRFVGSVLTRLEEKRP